MPARDLISPVRREKLRATVSARAAPNPSPRRQGRNSYASWRRGAGGIGEKEPGETNGGQFLSTPLRARRETHRRGWAGEALAQQPGTPARIPRPFLATLRRWRAGRKWL